MTNPPVITASDAPVDLASYLTVRGDWASTADARQILVQGDTNPNDQLTIGFQTKSEYGSIQAATHGTSTRPLVLNPLGGDVSIGLSTVAPAALDVKGAIRSPMWQVIPLMQNETGPLPITSQPFTTHAGTLVLFVNGTGWRHNSGGSIGLSVFIDGAIVDDLIVSVNPVDEHFAIVGTMVKTGLSAGPHTLTIARLSDAPDMMTDANDFYGVTVLELPF